MNNPTQTVEQPSSDRTPQRCACGAEKRLDLVIWSGNGAGAIASTVNIPGAAGIDVYDRIVQEAGPSPKPREGLRIPNPYPGPWLGATDGVGVTLLRPRIELVCTEEYWVCSDPVLVSIDTVADIFGDQALAQAAAEEDAAMNRSPGQAWEWLTTSVPAECLGTDLGPAMRPDEALAAIDGNDPRLDQAAALRAAWSTRAATAAFSEALHRDDDDDMGGLDHVTTAGYALGLHTGSIENAWLQLIDALAADRANWPDPHQQTRHTLATAIARLAATQHRHDTNGN